MSTGRTTGQDQDLVVVSARDPEEVPPPDLTERELDDWYEAAAAGSS